MEKTSGISETEKILTQLKEGKKEKECLQVTTSVLVLGSEFAVLCAVCSLCVVCCALCCVPVLCACAVCTLCVVCCILCAVCNVHRAVYCFVSLKSNLNQ